MFAAPSAFVEGWGTEMQPLSAAEFSDLVSIIYDCAIDPSGWDHALQTLRERMDFEQATLTLQTLPTGHVLVNRSSGIAEKWLEKIPAHAANIVAAWGGAANLARLPLEEPLLMSEVGSADAVRNRFVSEWLRPQGLVDSLTLGLARDTATLAAASFVRHVSAGPVGEEERGAIRLFAPHLKRSVTISRLLEAQTLTAANYRRIIDAVTIPILLTDVGLNLIDANDAARDMLDRRSPLLLASGQVGAADPVVSKAITGAVKAIGDPRQFSRMGLNLPARTQDGNCVIHLLPLGGTSRSALTADPALAIFVAGQADDAPTATLTALFGLTAAEAKVCAEIVSGRTTSAAATALGLQPSTVRTHLLRIYEKTGVHRQSELVRLAETFKSPLRAPPADGGATRQ